MKALYTFLLIASVAVFSLPAKAQWEQINSLYGGTVVDLLENSSGTLFAINYNRIYKSTDGGQWWEKIGRDFPEGIDDLLITSDDILFLVSYYNGIFRSMDDGNTWVKTTGGAQGPFHNLIYDQYNGKLLTPVNYNSTLLISDDYGESWQFFHSDHAFNIYEIVVDSSGKFFSLFNNNGATYLIRSDDGVVWTDSTLLPTSGGRDLSIDHYGRLYYYGNGIKRSADEGLTWETIFEGPAYRMYLWENGHIWAHARSDSLLFRSNDDGMTWDSLNLNLDYLWFFEASEEKFFVQSNDFESFYEFSVTHDYGVTWEWSAEGLLQSYIRDIFIDDSGTLFVNHYQKYKKSFDDGATWEEVTDLPLMGELKFKGKHLWLKKDSSLYRSSGNGQWTEIPNNSNGTWRSYSSHKSGNSLFVNNKMYWSNNFGDSLIELPQYFDEVYHLAADTVLGLIQRVGPYKSTEVFAHDIYRSVDGGFTWTLVHEMHGLEIHFYFPQFLTDSAGNVYLGNRENTLVRSRDRGATWSDLNIPGGGGNFNYFYLWASSAGDLYISNNTIIYRSKDFGETWQNYHQGLPTGGNF